MTGFKYGLKYDKKLCPINLEVQLWVDNMPLAGIYICKDDGRFVGVEDNRHAFIGANKFSLVPDDANTWTEYMDTVHGDDAEDTLTGFVYVDHSCAQNCITIDKKQKAINLALKDFLNHSYNDSQAEPEGAGKWSDVKDIPASWKNGSPVCFRVVTTRPYSKAPDQEHYHYSIGTYIAGFEADDNGTDLNAWSFEEPLIDAYSCDRAIKIDVSADEAESKWRQSMLDFFDSMEKIRIENGHSSGTI